MPDQSGHDGTRQQSSMVTCPSIFFSDTLLLLGGEEKGLCSEQTHHLL